MKDGYYYRPIPLKAISDYKATIHKGMCFTVKMPYQMRLDNGHFKNIVRDTVVDIESVYPNFIWTKGGMSINYWDLMVYSGWWEQNKSRYYPAVR